jgi:hypothetical protein
MTKLCYFFSCHELSSVAFWNCELFSYLLGALEEDRTNGDYDRLWEDITNVIYIIFVYWRS